jgi:DNA invertase Pin-like site-specific DNA recombinase
MKVRPKKPPEPPEPQADDLPLAVLYLRMSKHLQDTSIQAQRDKVYPFFQGKYRIIEEYIDEGKSGSHDTDKRENFLRLVRDLTIGK